MRRPVRLLTIRSEAGARMGRAHERALPDALVATSCLVWPACVGLAAWMGQIGPVWSASASAEVSATISAPLPVVSVSDVLPPAIATSGAVLIHLGSSDWLPVPQAALPTGEGGVQTVVATAMTVAQQQAGVLQGGVATSVSSSSSKGHAASRAPGAPDAGDEQIRILVEFN